MSTEKLQEVIHSGTIQRYHSVVQYQQTGPQGTILSCPLRYSPNYTGKIFLNIKNTVYIISNWVEDQFPNVIYICLFGYTQGYRQAKVNSNTYQPTDKVAALQLDQVTSTVDGSGVRTYELKYCLRESLYWNITSVGGGRLFMRIKTDNNQDYQTLPLPNPMTLSFDLKFE